MYMIVAGIRNASRSEQGYIYENLEFAQARGVDVRRSICIPVKSSGRCTAGHVALSNCSQTTRLAEQFDQGMQ
jgi:hypothetical protein